jgi:VanZ family protein
MRVLRNCFGGCADAGVAQLVEQRIRNAKVGSSTLLAGTRSDEGQQLLAADPFVFLPFATVTIPILSALRRRLLIATTSPAAVARWRWLLGALAFTVFWLALSPAPPDGLNTGWDKLNHAGAFAALTVVAIFALPRPRCSLWLLLGCLLCFGGAIEVAQSFTPTRSAEWGDLLADAIGMAAGLLATAVLTRIVSGRPQSR